MAVLGRHEASTSREGAHRSIADRSHRVLIPVHDFRIVNSGDVTRGAVVGLIGGLLARSPMTELVRQMPRGARRQKAYGRTSRPRYSTAAWRLLAPARNAQRLEPHLDRTERAEHHRCVDVAHVGGPERAALQLTNPAAEDDAALLATVVADHARLAALHEHRGHRVRALPGADDGPDCATPSAISSRSAAHFSKASSAGQSAWPQSVSPYSTLGGT